MSSTRTTLDAVEALHFARTLKESMHKESRDPLLTIEFWRNDDPLLIWWPFMFGETYPEPEAEATPIDEIVEVMVTTVAAVSADAVRITEDTFVITETGRADPSPNARAYADLTTAHAAMCVGLHHQDGAADLQIMIPYDVDLSHNQIRWHGDIRQRPSAAGRRGLADDLTDAFLRPSLAARFDEVDDRTADHAALEFLTYRGRAVGAVDDGTGVDDDLVKLLQGILETDVSVG